jgi:hypothetical protein
VQLADGLKVPVELVVKLTDPVGLVGVAEVSMTVALQPMPLVPTGTELGEQMTLVVVVWGGTGIAARRNVPWLDA